MADIESARREKLKFWRSIGINPFDNTFRVTHTSANLRKRFDGKTAEELKEIDEEFSVAGRIILMRVIGKLMFLKLRDRGGDIQVALEKSTLGDEQFGLAKKLEVGDIIGAKGTIMRTHTGELTVGAKTFKLLTKNLIPLPEKYHGLRDVELRYRQRYVDLAVNPNVQEIFRKRAAVVKYIRNFLEERDFLEVETPMMQPIAGGANARPFITHHNALNMELYLRIAPELYLKRLLVGGLERVYEINRNFRNEGIDTHHNPEFTMLEFYWAYARYDDLILLTEELISGLVKQITGDYKIKFGDMDIDFTPPWRKLSIRDAVVEFGKARGITADDLKDRESMANAVHRLGNEVDAHAGEGKLLMELYELLAEGNLVNPTFIIEHPAEISPLSRRNDERPDIVDRFELIVGGMEIANAFSELNDPDDQAERFRAQLEAKAAGDEEAHEMDEDYIRALSYGMPPAAGEGIGIDRLAMLVTSSTSIREVILFPLLKQEEGKGDWSSEAEEPKK